MPNQNTKKTHCKRGHPLSGLNLYVTKSGGRVCKECQRIHNRAFYQRNLEKMRERGRTEDTERKRNRFRDYQRSNPDYFRNRNRAQRAKRREANDGFSPWMVRYYRYVQEQRCFYCGVTIHVDAPRCHSQKENLEHVVPLSRGGKHSWSNTVLSCFSCNMKKNNKTAEEFCQEENNCG